MKPFTIIYTFQGRDWKTTREHWTKEQAVKDFETNNPNATVTACWASTPMKMRIQKPANQPYTVSLPTRGRNYA